MSYEKLLEEYLKDGIDYDANTIKKANQADLKQLAADSYWQGWRDRSEIKVVDKPRIVCICGSGRFLELMHKVEEILTLKGEIVLMIGVNTKDVARTEDLEHFKPMLDELHLRKIDLADYVYVVNKDSYIGESTRNEIEYAQKQGMPVTYLEPID
ncbi:MAG TPA: hypothetical protein VMV77_04165 [Bacteroidales bacterium]|nr:hypothetical protein [Bacteroidales bacterium]